MDDWPLRRKRGGGPRGPRRARSTAHRLHRNAKRDTPKCSELTPDTQRQLQQEPGTAPLPPAVPALPAAPAIAPAAGETAPAAADLVSAVAPAPAVSDRTAASPVCTESRRRTRKEGLEVVHGEQQPPAADSRPGCCCLGSPEPVMQPQKMPFMA